MASTVGQQLKKARLERELTLEQVSKAIFLRVGYLEALENDQRDVLPSPVQAKGYLRLYAGHLGLPVEPLLELWEGMKTDTDVLPSGPDEESVEEEGLAPAVIEVEAPEAPAVPPAPPIGGPHGVLEVKDTSSQAVFSEIGRKLHEQREALGLSLAEVERFTRLRQHYLQALEEGRMDDLPSPVQGRGMLSNYVAFLNLNEDQLLLRFAEGLQQRRLERLPPVEEVTPQSRKRPARQASPLRQFLTPDLIFGVIVVGAILFFAIRTAASISSLRSEQTLPTTRAISEVLIATSPVSSELLGTAVSAVEGQPPGQTTELPALDPTDLPAETSDVEIVEITAAATGTAPTLGAIGRINDDPIQVYIVARQRAWLRVLVDNQVQFNGRVISGNAYAFSGSKNIEILTGNGAALQVFHNQQDLGALGLAGEVVNIVFSLDGLQTPTPTLTYTATVTPRVTITPTATPDGDTTQTITPFVP